MARKKTAFRAAHGKSKRLGRLTASEVPPMDELPRPTAPAQKTEGSQRTEHGYFGPGNTVSRSKRPRPSAMGTLAEYEAKWPDAWKKCSAWGRRWAKHRCSELSELYGKLSSGPTMLIMRAGERYGDAAFLRTIGRMYGGHEVIEFDPVEAVPLVDGAKGKRRRVKTNDSLALIRTAAQLEREAAADQRDAIAMAAMEYDARPKGEGMTPLDLVKQRILSTPIEKGGSP